MYIYVCVYIIIYIRLWSTALQLFSGTESGFFLSSPIEMTSISSVENKEGERFCERSFYSRTSTDSVSQTDLLTSSQTKSEHTVYW